MVDYGRLEQIILPQLGEHRRNHTLGVVATAVSLAERFGINVQKAEIAALLHDVAREWSAERLLEWAQKYNLLLTPADRKVPALLHGPIGASVAEKEYGIHDAEILQAISSHTMGNNQMSGLDKIIFLADMIEPGRAFPGVEELRKQAITDLNTTVLAAFDHTLQYIIAEGGYIHPTSLEARNYLWTLVHEGPNISVTNQQKYK